MAGASAITKHQKLTIEQNQQDPNKFYYHFLYKAAIVLIFFVIPPLFPSQAPEFINQSLLTKNWELLHLLFVGVAISYGLFSRRNNETEKENNNSKLDTAESLVSRFLQVSSFFEDEAENPVESDETKLQTWSNQHYRNEPVVVVAPQLKHSGFDDQNGANEKPLLLPVRSLKSRLCDDAGDVDAQSAVDESYTTTSSSFSINRSTASKTGSKRFSSNSNRVARNAELEGPGSPRIEAKMKENTVLPSPIPWRSRSGRMEPKQEEVNTPAQLTSMEESEFSKVESRPVKSQTSRSSRTSSLSPSPKLGPSLSISSESLAKNAEDLMRKKGFYKSCPPPPPPPPPMMFHKSISMKPRYGGSFSEGGSFDKELKRSFTGERSGTKSGIEMKPRNHAEIMSMGKNSDEKEHSMQEPTRGYERTSFRTDKFMPRVSEPAGSMEFVGEEKKSFLDKVLGESDDDEDDEDTETEDEDAGGGRIIRKESGESPIAGGESSKTDEPSSGAIGDEGPDVDKKADEFIAKFREQIRLQRIECIKRSTRTTRNSLR